MRMFFLPVASIAARNPGSSQEFIEVRSTTGCPGKNVEKLGPNIAAKGFRFDGGEDGRDAEFLGDFGKERHVIDERSSVDTGYAKCHLRLVIDEDNSAVFRGV